MRYLSVTLVFFVAARCAFGQGSSIGVAPYHHPDAAKYRASFGVGGNLGHGADAPLAYIGSASYQLGNSLYGASLIESESVTWPSPRISFTEFDVLYGIAFDADLARYEASPQSLHTSISAGVGFQSYNTRWRVGGGGRRGFMDTTGLSQALFQSGGNLNSFEFSACFPVQVQVLYEPFSFAGIGLTAFLSISKLTPSYGAAVSVQARY